MNQIDLPVLKFERKRTTAKQCPCGKNNSDGKFAPYAGFVDCGFCHSCGTNFLPPINKDESYLQNKVDAGKQNKKIKPISFISVDIFKASLSKLADNNFIQFLLKRFGSEITTKQIEKYFIGTSKHWSGATVFWQIDHKGKIRTGKIMLYNAINGKRIKEPFNHIQWVHKVIEQSEFELKQCFFGQHLINDNDKPLAIVESEKTAIIASIYFPQFVWLAVGSKTNLTFDRMTALNGRKVVLFPDLNCFDDWQKKANEFSILASITVSDLLEKKASEQEKKDGLDLADYLLRFDLKEFHKDFSQVIKETESLPIVLIDEVVTENQNLIKAVIKNNIDKDVDFLLQVCINKCLFQSQSKEFSNYDYKYFLNELKRTI